MENALVIAPHPDDECLGPGGAIALMSNAGIAVTVVTVGSEQPPDFQEGAREVALGEARTAHKILGVSSSIFLDFPTIGISKMSTAELNGPIEQVVEELRPTVVLVPFPDRHTDHRAVFDASLVATRPFRQGTGVKLVAMYETVSETYWNAPGAEPTFAPHWTADIEAVIETKLTALEAYKTRLVDHPGPRSLESVRALAVFRGSQASYAFGESYQVVRASFPPTALFKRHLG